MANWKKLASGAAGAAGGAGGLDVDDVFSTYLYEGNSGTAQTITNNIDLSGEGGFVWIKQRSQNNYHYLFDTQATGNTSGLLLPLTSGKSASTTALTSFNSDGFSLGSNAGVNGTHDMASWTFRKAPKFFDVVTYTGNGTAGKTVSHNLGSVPGMIVVKRTDTSGEWMVYHRGANSSSPENYRMFLNRTNSAGADVGVWHNTAPTDTQFTVGYDSWVNANGGTYVAYLFAHNDGDGEFGPTGDQDIIKCGSYTGSGGNTTVDLGFEPQWVMVKAAGTSSNWFITDNMRGITFGNDPMLYANETNSEESRNYFELTSTGFKAKSTAVDSSGTRYIYIAIRRGPMAVPESASDVFNVQSKAENGYYGYIGKPVDLWMNRPVNQLSDTVLRDRLRGSNLLTCNTDNAEQTGGVEWYTNNEGAFATTSTDTNHISWTWRRAPNFFDIVAYTGNGTSGRTISHNLGVAPEMIWVKARAPASRDWTVYHKGLNGGTNPETYFLQLNNSAAEVDAAYFHDTAPTDSHFTVGSFTDVNRANEAHIAYLFASLDGISKLGSYTGNGSTQDISLGFSPRLFITKNTDSTYPWYLFDSKRGIVAGNDPFIILNTNAAQGTSVDMIDPITNGVRLINSSVNNSGDNYIYYAIA